MRPVRNSPPKGPADRAKRAGAISNGMRYVIGIDEVGRGPLAGPVVLAAVAIPMNWRPRLRPRSAKASPGKQGSGGRNTPLRDSKKLTAIQRELWHAHLAKDDRINTAIAKAYPGTIDGINIARAANQAARRALRKAMSFLSANSYELAGVYLDGGLYLKQLRHARRRASVHTEIVSFGAGSIGLTAHTVVKGDEKITAVKVASIFAKVYRDKLMTRAAKKFPGYGFEIHKGYGTSAHRKAIKKLGPSKIHRLTFLRTSWRQPRGS